MTTALPQQQQASGNELLSRLTVHERNAVQRGAEAVSLATGEVLLRAHTHSDHVWFPIRCVASVNRTLRSGSSVELALIGSEGMIGLDAFMEAKTQLDDVTVTTGGWAYRMLAGDLEKQFRRAGSLQKYLLRFTFAYLAQVSQTAVCMQSHAAQPRLARRLLMINDRTGHAAMDLEPSSDQATMTALAALVSRGCVSTRHNVVTIRDREGLEMTACECYETIRQEYGRTLSS